MLLLTAPTTVPIRWATGEAAQVATPMRECSQPVRNSSLRPELTPDDGGRRA